MRERERDEAAAAVAEARMAIEKLDGQHAQIIQEYDELDGMRKRASVGEVHPSRLLDIQRYQLVLHTELRQNEDNRQKVFAELQRREAVLVEKQQAVKSLEKLRASQQQEYENKLARQSQDRIDEFNTVRSRFNGP
jgi:flagellar export protein FliJ